jgi:hypothetical protein
VSCFGNGTTKECGAVRSILSDKLLMDSCTEGVTIRELNANGAQMYIYIKKILDSCTKGVTIRELNTNGAHMYIYKKRVNRQHESPAKIVHLNGIVPRIPCMKAMKNGCQKLLQHISRRLNECSGMTHILNQHR